MSVLALLKRLRRPDVAVVACIFGITATALVLGGSCGRRKSQPGRNSAAPSPGQCNNSYFPVADDMKFEYRCDFSGGLPGYALTVTFTEVGDSSFVRQEQTSADLTSESEWKCRSDGLIPLNCNDFAAPQPRLKLTTSSSSGVMIPLQSKWQKGTKWGYSYQVSGEMMFGGAPKPVDVSGTVSVASEIEGSERVTVPGGTFDAMRVVSRTVEHLVLKGGESLPGDIVFSTTAWYAKDTGLIKVQSDDLKVTTVLTAFSRQQPAPEDDDNSSAALVSIRLPWM